MSETIVSRNILADNVPANFFRSVPGGFFCSFIESGDVKRSSLTEDVNAEYNLVADEQLSCPWEMPHVVDEMKKTPGDENSSAFELLPNFVVVTGSPRGFECATCGSYLTKRWQNVGLPVLRMLSVSIDSLQKGERKMVEFVDPMLGRIFISRYCIGLMDHKPVDHEVVEVLTWLCAAIRLISKGNSEDAKREVVHLSSIVDHVVDKTHRLSMQLKTVFPQDLQAMFLADATCWFHMFETFVIVWQSENESPEKLLPGLEIPFDMMVHLASVQNYCHVDGGIVMVGVFTALIPIRRDPARSSGISNILAMTV